MKKTKFLITSAVLCIAGLGAISVSLAAKKASKKRFSINQGQVSGKLDSYVIATGQGRVFLFDKTGKIVKQYRRRTHFHDLHVLKNGNILFAGGNMCGEINPAGKTVWQYIPKKQKGGGAYSATRLENGNTLVGENSTGRVLEIDPKGKIVFQLQTRWKTKNAHQQMRLARKLKNGNYLVCASGDKTVREYTPKGKIVWEKHNPKAMVCYEAKRLKNGNTIISWLTSVAEYDKNGKLVWELKPSDLKPLVSKNYCSIQVLPNGNFVFGCYAAYNRTPKGRTGTGCFEVTRDKKVVWSYSNPYADKNLITARKLTDAQAKTILNLTGTEKKISPAKK